jgi:hypothetical protein
MTSVGSLCYALADFLRKILSSLARKSESLIKNLAHFVQLLKSVNLQSLDTLVSFDVINVQWHIDRMVCLAGRSHCGAAGSLF